MRTFIFYVLVSLVFTSCQSQTKHECSFPYTNHQPEDDCGFVEVPRNWDTDSKETTKLAYLVIHSKSDNRKEDPVIFLQGGPGGSVLSQANIYSQINLDRDRDYILYDQRGIGFSEELCPGLSLELFKIMALDLDISQEITELKKRVQSCTNALKIDSRQFSTITSVKDLEALRQHLGYEQFNLFGGSYGTRLGLKYMERYPKKVRSAVLSGLFSPETRMYDNLFSNFNRALGKVFQDCAQDNGCNIKYPNLQEEFLSIYNDLKDNPMTLEINGDAFILNQQDILLFMHQLLYSNTTIERIPAFIRALKENNTGFIAQTISAFLPRFSIINLGVYYSVMTADEGRFNNQAKVNTDSKNSMFNNGNLSLFSADPEIIKLWPIKSITSNSMDLATSDIPTLLISGDYDPVTPPNNGNLVTKSLRNTQHFVFSNNGHVPINGCFFGLAKQFLNNPGVQLDGSCAKTSTVFSWD